MEFSGILPMPHEILASYLDFICTTAAEYNRIQENTGHESIFTVYFYLLIIIVNSIFVTCSSCYITEYVVSSSGYCCKTILLTCMDQFPKPVLTIRQSKRKHKFILVLSELRL